MSEWVVVPAAPLEAGGGFRIWYSHARTSDFKPREVKLRKEGNPVAAKQDWSLLPVVAGLDRRMGIRTITLEPADPDAEYEVEVPESRSGPFRWKTLAKEIPEEGVAFFLASCFYLNNDKDGFYSAAVRQLTKQWRPSFKFMAGDQLYGDWPSEVAPGRPHVALYAARYEEYWGNSVYQELLQTTPNFFMCDDHEFWNDYPERQIHLARTWREEDRKECGVAADQLYHCYQRCANPGDNRWYNFKVGKVSFFVADSRSRRTEINCKDGPHFFEAEQWTALEAWAQHLNGPGVLVIGQPPYQKDGNLKDHSLSNFASDYGRLWSIIKRSQLGENQDGKPHDVLLLSGDIHTGRYAVGRAAGIDGATGVPEFIASPASRVWSPKIRGGEGDPKEPPAQFRPVHQGKTTLWRVDPGPFMTTDDNVGMVRLFPGTADRVRFELSIFQVREYDSRSWWERTRGRQRPSGTLDRLFLKDDLELR